MPNADVIKDRLNQALCLRDISAAELARRSGLNKGIISRYLHGKAIPKPGSTEAMAAALGVSPVWLLGYDDDIKVVPMLPDNPVDLSKLTKPNRIRVITYYQALLDSQTKIPE